MTVINPTVSDKARRGLRLSGAPGTPQGSAQVDILSPFTYLFILPEPIRHTLANSGSFQPLFDTAVVPFSDSQMFFREPMFHGLLTIAPALSLVALLFLPAVAPAQLSPHGSLRQQCSDCHSTVSWTQLNSSLGFDHDTTAFPLRGQHRSATCTGCHTTLRFAGTSADCISCHWKDFDAAVSVSHRSAGFSTDCTDCHSADASSWLASFDHDRTNFPTRGAHQALPCTACHAGNRFRGTPVECVGCHQQQYASAQKPNHVAAGFSTDCAMCHRALAWQPAAFFPHGWFPIDASARHSPGRWNSCTDCHPAQPNYSTFECIFCHHHDKASTDRAHLGRVDDYQYKSTACYRCHPAGEAGGGGG